MFSGSGPLEFIEPCCASPSFTPPIIVYVPPFRPGSLLRTPGLAYDYEADLQRALSESFDEQRDVEPIPASERTLRAIAKTPVVLQEDATCGICLERMIAGQTAIVAGCCHATSHAECIERALLVTPRCPFCRFAADE